MRNFGDADTHSLHASMQLAHHSAPEGIALLSRTLHWLGSIALVREHYTTWELV